MPIYEYQCTGCHHAFDLIQKMSDEPVKQCPLCSELTAVRLVSAPQFQLKGTGWYATDFKNKGQTESKADTKKTTTSTSTASSSSEAKPATPAPASATSKDA
jgi:putative FmdB family regulatory protein